MTPATLALVERLAKDCIAEDWTDHDPGYYRDMNLERFWQAAMEHAAGICDQQRVGIDAFGGIEHHIHLTTEQCAAAIRQAAK